MRSHAVAAKLWSPTAPSIPLDVPATFRGVSPSIALPLVAGPTVATADFAKLRREMVLNHCKWDPQVEDTNTLCPFPLLISERTWHELSTWSQQLFRETLELEIGVWQQPRLISELGLPRAITRVLSARRDTPLSASVARVMRFDFHWTTAGWRISEVNSDVPGGFIEAGAFTRLMAKLTRAGMPCGDPAATYMASMAAAGSGPVGFVHATAYSDDRQVMEYLARELSSLGIEGRMMSPSEITWHEGIAHAKSALDMRTLVRFFPAEWLPNLGRKSQWEYFFRGSISHWSNPAWALLSQSKRLPLVWNQLPVDAAAWRELLPDTCDPRACDWQRDPDWVVKPALGRVGDSIRMLGVTAERELREIHRSVRWWPGAWVAQRRFEAVPIITPLGAAFPVLGVYVIDGIVAGVYGRLAMRPIIDHVALDVAVLQCDSSIEAKGITGS